jgi:hypothetical protein
MLAFFPNKCFKFSDKKFNTKFKIFLLTQKHINTIDREIDSFQRYLK